MIGGLYCLKHQRKWHAYKDKDWSSEKIENSVSQQILVTPDSRYKTYEIGIFIWSTLILEIFL